MAELKLSYVPRPQFVAFHQRSERFACLVCHRRAGKSVASVNELLLRALYTKKTNARYGYVAPFYSQAKNIAWQYLKEAAEPFVASPKDIRESELRVRLINGSWITLYGSDNIDALRGLYFDGIILDEFGDMKPDLWHTVVLPTLADRKGWAVVVGTPKQHNQFYHTNELAKEDPAWFQMTLKSSESGIIPEDELKLMKSQMSADQFDQEMEVSFEAAVMGTYYASIVDMIEKNGQTMKKNLYDPEFPVFAACDLGFTDSTAFWFWQVKPDGLAIIDHYEAHSEPLQHYFDHLQTLPYEYETIWLPHDARAKTLQTGRSTIEQFLEYGFPCQITPSLKLQHGIDAARLVLPLCHFDEKTQDGVEALRAYKRRYDPQTKVYSNAPLHNWASHSADAFRYTALVARTGLNLPTEDAGYSPRTKKPPLFKQKGYTLNELFNEREAANSAISATAKLRI